MRFAKLKYALHNISGSSVMAHRTKNGVTTLCGLEVDQRVPRCHSQLPKWWVQIELPVSQEQRLRECQSCKAGIFKANFNG